MGIMQFLIPLVKAMYDVKDAAGNVITSATPTPWSTASSPHRHRHLGAAHHLAIIGIAEKDRPEFYGLGGKQETVKLSEYARSSRPTSPCGA